jgi:uncharacterized protein (UPF0332 family)
MSFDWRHYHDAASEWKNSASGVLEEAFLRTSISRAYYAALHVAKERFLRPEWEPFGGEFHDKTIRAIQQHNSVCATILKSMRKHRNEADYKKIFPGNIQRMAQHVLLESKKVLEM